MKKILVTGGTGMVGQALQNIIKDDAVFLSSSDRDWETKIQHHL